MNNLNKHYYLIEEIIDINKYYNLAIDPICGAITMFSGTTRDYFIDNGIKKTVTKLSYESYNDMVFNELKRIEDEIRKQWNIKNFIFVHRLGEVPITESSILLVVSSSHRQDSLQAIDYAINTIKKTLPIFKKEHYSDNSSIWKEQK